MSRTIRSAGLLVISLLATLLLPATAQTPTNRPPGTTCVTPEGWCPAIQPGPPGGHCACNTNHGWVRGTLR